MKPIVLLLSLMTILVACKEQKLSSDPSHHLTFSVDSVCFDTVFTTMGSSTRKIMVYNRNSSALRIESVQWKTTFFQVTLDGENDPSRLRGIQLNGGDSLYLFVRVVIPEQRANVPQLVEDTLVFDVNGHTQCIPLEAYGQDVHLFRTRAGKTQLHDYTFVADKPYLIFDTLILNGTTTIAEGVTLYMHQGSSLYLYGDCQAIGSAQRPIRILGDRLDWLFQQVPYRVASGQWGGIYSIRRVGEEGIKSRLEHVEILSGNVGFWSVSTSKDTLNTVQIGNSRIHNHAHYGVVLEHTDAHLWNNEISNCASYCVYMAGGKQTLAHNTIASYFGWPSTNINIHSTAHKDVAAVYVDTIAESPTLSEVNILNCIITGTRNQNLTFAGELPADYTGKIIGNYLRNDSIKGIFSHGNTYATDTDKVFKNTQYLYKEYRYYDFGLDSLSVVIGKADSAVVAQETLYQTDLLDRPRTAHQPSAGCYIP